MVGYLTTQNGTKAERIARLYISGIRSVVDKTLIQIKLDDEIYSVMIITPPDWRDDGEYELWIVNVIKNYEDVHDTFIEKIYNHESFYRLLKADTAWVV